MQQNYHLAVTVQHKSPQLKRAYSLKPSFNEQLWDQWKGVVWISQVQMETVYFEGFVYC